MIAGYKDKLRKENTWNAVGDMMEIRLITCSAFVFL